MIFNSPKTFQQPYLYFSFFYKSNTLTESDFKFDFMFLAMAKQISSLIQRNQKGKCDGNICINRSKMTDFIILEQIFYVEFCGECRELSKSILQIQSLTDVTQSKHFPSPFLKWEDITLLQFNCFTTIRLLRRVLKFSNIIRDFISSIWYGFEELEAGIENIISNIHIVENLNNTL